MNLSLLLLPIHTRVILLQEFFFWKGRWRDSNPTFEKSHRALSVLSKQEKAIQRCVRHHQCKFCHLNSSIFFYNATVFVEQQKTEFVDIVASKRSGILTVGHKILR